MRNFFKEMFDEYLTYPEDRVFSGYKKVDAFKVWQFTKENYSLGVPIFIKEIKVENLDNKYDRDNIVLWSHHGGEVISGELRIVGKKIKSINENDYIVKDKNNKFKIYNPKEFKKIFVLI